MTIQITEKLIFNGEKVEMRVSSSPTLPKDRPQIIDGDDGFAMSACWRGYVGTWEVKTDKLYLVELSGQYMLKDNAPIFADWFTGTIVAPQGGIIHHPGHIGECLHEADLCITIESGNVLKTETVDNQDRLLSRKAEQSRIIDYEIPAFLRHQAD